MTRPPIIQIITTIVLIVLIRPIKTQTIPAKEDLRHGMELCVQENYDQAFQFFTDIRQRYPKDPAPHFFMAAILQTKMMDFETLEWHNAFELEIDTTLALSEAILKVDPENIHARFYHGSALSYISFQMAREKKYLQSINRAITAMYQLHWVMENDSTCYDVYLGWGSYKYWRSYLTRHFNWLPFFRDQRQEGIEYIITAYEYGSFSKWAALSNLAWIYIQEGQYREAIQCAKTGLSTFPDSRFFMWPWADAHYGQGNYRASLEAYKKLLQSVRNEQYNNHYNEIVLHLKIANCYFKLGDVNASQNHVQALFAIHPEESVGKSLQPKFKEAEELLETIKSRIP